MRCDEVMDNLVSPSLAHEQAEVQAHLARCPACAERIQGLARLDRLWDATRPDEPGPDAWDAVWASVSARLDGEIVRPSTIPALLMWRARPSWRRPALVGLACAAAVLLAVIVPWRGRGIDPAAPSVPSLASVAVIEADVDIEDGSLPVLRYRDGRLEVEDLTHRETPSGVDGWLVWYNMVESMGSPRLARQE